MTRVFISLGANIGAREANLNRAVALIAETPGIEVRAVSSFRETDPVGYLDQPRFLNGALEAKTALSAQALLDRLLAIERSLGRTREGPRFGPRKIDLDLLLYGEEEIDKPGLRVPHPRLHERRFVLEPLAELDPGLEVPGLGSLQALLATLD